jgi:hypothetical protein
VIRIGLRLVEIYAAATHDVALAAIARATTVAGDAVFGTYHSA